MIRIPQNIALPAGRTAALPTMFRSRPMHEAGWVVVFPLPFLPLNTGMLGYASKAAIALALFLMVCGLLGRGVATLNKRLAKPALLCCVLVFQGSFLAAFYGNISIPAAIVDSQFFIYVLILSMYFSVFGSAKQVWARLIRGADLALLLFLGELILIAYRAGGGFADATGSVRLSPSLGPSAGAIFLVFVYLVNVDEWLRHRRSPRLAIAVCSVALIYFTTTRIALGAVIVSTLVLTREHRVLGLNRITFLVALTALVSFLAILSRLHYDDGTGSGINTNGRLAVWESLYLEAAQAPLIGSGFGRSFSLMEKLDPWMQFGVQPHNDYLRLVLSMGWVGLAGFLGVIAMLWRCTKSVSPASRRGQRQSLSRSLLAAFLVLMTTDNVFIYHFFTYPMLVVVLGSAASARTPK